MFINFVQRAATAKPSKSEQSGENVTQEATLKTEESDSTKVEVTQTYQNEEKNETTESEKEKPAS